jgi:hypothetical protein
MAVPRLFAQSGTPEESPKVDRSYKLLRGDEDWSFLQDPTLRDDFWDPVKYIRLRHHRNDWYLTIGGEARWVWEQGGNDYWGESPFWNNFFLQRYMLGFDFHCGEHFQTLVEFKSGLESFRIGGPRPIDKKLLDFQNAFVEVGTSAERSWIKLRVGIQELEYLVVRHRIASRFKRSGMFWTVRGACYTIGLLLLKRAVGLSWTGPPWDYSPLSRPVSHRLDTVDALDHNMTLRNAALTMGFANAEDFDRILDPNTMVGNPRRDLGMAS